MQVRPLTDLLERAASASSRPSPPSGATNCTPSGRPAAVMYSGTEIAGRPVMFASCTGSGPGCRRRSSPAGPRPGRDGRACPRRSAGSTSAPSEGWSVHRPVPRRRRQRRREEQIAFVERHQPLRVSVPPFQCRKIVRRRHRPADSREDSGIEFENHLGRNRSGGELRRPPVRARRTTWSGSPSPGDVRRRPSRPVRRGARARRAARSHRRRLRPLRGRRGYRG